MQRAEPLIEAFLANPTEGEAALAAALQACASEREGAWKLAEHAGHLLGFHDCVIYFLDVNQHDLFQVAAWGHKQVTPRLFENPIRLPVGRGIVGACARDWVPVLVCDTELDPRYVVDEAKRRSELAVPILGQRNLIGVIDSEHLDVDAFRSIHVRALLRLAAIYSAWFDARPRVLVH